MLPSPASRPVVRLLVAVAMIAAALGVGACGASSLRSARAGDAFVRVNQVGYGLHDPKRAELLTHDRAAGSLFRVVDARGATVLQGRVGRDVGAWSPTFPHVYRLEFSAVRRAGSYRIIVAGAGSAVSPRFRVASLQALYAPLAADALRFLRAERDGPDVDRSILGRRPSHLADRHALVYATPTYGDGRLAGSLRRVGGPVDVAGGWMDAGDTLKFAETVSFTETLLLYALRDYPDGLGGARHAAEAEARHGMNWLLELWDPRRETLIYQVGLGDGNAKIEGAHDSRWRLPEDDDRVDAPPGSRQHYVKDRPAFRAGPPGTLLSPNLAGRMAGAFALGAQVFAARDPAYAARCLHAARTIFARARTHAVRHLLASTPPSFYPEVEWRDDMELGAAELALATRGQAAKRYARTAARWAEAYASSPLNGTDSFNLYDVAALAHADLARLLRRARDGELDGASRATLVQDLDGQIGLAQDTARRDPFGAGSPYADDDVVQHALGLAVEAGVRDAIAGASRRTRFALSQRDFVLGANAWGTSFMVGAGTTFPHCLHHPVANLKGSLDGKPPLLVGATVPGPVRASELRHLELPPGYRACPPDGRDRFARFSGHGGRYADAVADSPTVEPSIDLAALALLAFAQEASRAR